MKWGSVAFTLAMIALAILVVRWLAHFFAWIGHAQAERRKHDDVAVLIKQRRRR